MNTPFYNFKSSKGFIYINILHILYYNTTSVILIDGSALYTDDSDDDSNTDGLTDFITNYYTP